MQQVGTFQTTGGLSGTTRVVPAARLRLAGLGLIAAAGAVLFLWASRTTWMEVEKLRAEFAGLRADTFYLGVRMRGDFLRLNETLLRYRLRGDTNEIAAFYVQSRDFGEWLARNSANALTPLERDFFRDAGKAYGVYLVESLSVLQAGLGRPGANQAIGFKQSYEKLQAQSQAILELCDSFIDNQQTSFGDFLKKSQRTLAGSEEMLRVSLVLILVLGGALVALVYRGMIAPLRHQLTETQAIVARQEKLASLGVLAAGVAHEIRNPLTAIKFRLFSLKKALPPAIADGEDAAVIGSEITRLERIVRDFLQFARPSEPDLAAVPAQRIAREVADLLRPQLEKDAIALRLETSGEDWVRADVHQIKQVLINLIRNAAESIGRSGLITVRVRAESGPGRQGASAVMVEVADNGKGIPPEVQKRLFDPFFTTKEGGTGLGLPIAARIIEKHGGQLRYQTEPRRGTTFRVILPRWNEHENEPALD